ncbi:hypothetical protein [Methyloversatilis discipulorum]|uniref:hypothetical protein n=1 Tax=Methyloversatilis discipulorum TaxID=1119528 RepID=UPI00035D0959|nr:hypothetical protein [Methyloversatilis discipulorum]
MYIHRLRQACISLLVGAALLAASAAQAARVETAGPLAAPQIVGLWSWTDESQCVESYEYRSDGTGRVSSGNEQTDVSYVFSSVPVADDFFELNVTIRHNSGGKDCLGQNADDSGETYRVFVHFRQGEDSHLVCYRPDVTQCFGPLYRQALPRF